MSLRANFLVQNKLFTKFAVDSQKLRLEKPKIAKNPDLDLQKSRKLGNICKFCGNNLSKHIKN